MKFNSPKFWISTLSMSVIFYVALVNMGRQAPGPLATVHARESKLTGFGSCSNCHGGWTATMTESCLECHQDISAQIDDRKGLHGTFGETLVQSCSTCHSDHNGEGFAMVNQRSFAVAGLGERREFDHARVGFEMTGRHTELECRACHEHADTLVLPEGAKRFLGLRQDCASCHEDAHERRMRLDCATCHGQESFEQLEARDHDRHLALVGGHASVTCSTCHALDTAHALERVGAAPGSSKRQCVACHDSPHAQPFVTAVGRSTRQEPGASCATCHTAEHTSFRDETLTMLAERHALTGFPLDAPHAEATCVDCHGDAEQPFAKRYPGRAADRCAECHEDPHGGQFDVGRFAAKGCVSCHEHSHFDPHAFTAERHAQSGFALTGRHAETDCAKCHKQPADGRPRIFAGTSLQCASCHGDAHGGFFARFESELKTEPNGTCVSCHDTGSFGREGESEFDHLRFTEFAITGAHAQVDCEECHVRSQRPDRFGRTFGRVKDRHGSIGKGGMSCVACHTDPHRGGFDRPGLPNRVGTANGCERCHTHTSFRTLKKGFDHGLWTGFALRDAHAKARCTDCHEPLRQADPNGRTWGGAKGKQCAACHEDPHVGQFDPVPKRLPNGRREPQPADCARCHKASKFADLLFNHELHSRFPLGDRHKDVGCAKCHKAARTGGTEFVRYRPIPRDCSSCHGKQQDPFRRRRGRKQ